METDVIVIGSGQGGVPLATGLAEAGKHVILVEKGPLGGTCVNFGCTPTKTMMASARAAHVARRAGRLGVRAGDVEVDLAAVVDRKTDIVRQWREGVQRRVDGPENLRLIRGIARFVGPREIEVDDKHHSADTIVLNVGARSRVPALAGLDSVDFLDNASIMELRSLPRHLLIIGGGYIACEFGQMFRRFGSRVTIMERNEHLLARGDADVSEAIESVFREEEIELVLAAEASRVSRHGDEIVVRCSGGEETRGSHLLVAVGRVPNTDDLGCDAAGIDLDGRGSIEVDDSFRTSAEGVYALGDCTAGPQFTHNSWDEGRILQDILMGKRKGGRGGRIVPSTVFTDPQVAHVGLSEREARSGGIDYEVATLDFGNIARAIEIDETSGLLKVLIDPRTERILGASIVGYEAGELLHTFVMMMHAGASARTIVDAQIVHPTLAEGLQSVVMSLDRYR
jgi:pyruvate/2-oxoglutarate dehydrogenase complex dihydrolipoamide dehydrogenase (E3) component